MTDGIDIAIEGLGALIATYADLRQLPVAKVVRNAARDYAKAAQKATPVAQISKSRYYYYWRDGKRRYVPQEQVLNPKKHRTLHKQRVGKNWSRASWLGVFRSLGLELRTRPPQVSPKAAQALQSLSYAIARSSGNEAASMEITDHIAFNRWGRGTDYTSERIVEAGLAAASATLSKQIQRMMAK